jgi:hypothetical protein
MSVRETEAAGLSMKNNGEVGVVCGSCTSIDGYIIENRVCTLVLKGTENIFG